MLADGVAYTVEGRVRDAATKDFISAAVVLLGQRSTTSNSEGVFRFSSVPAHNYELNASADGYVSNSKHLNVTGNIEKGTLADIILTRVLESGRQNLLIANRVM